MSPQAIPITALAAPTATPAATPIRTPSAMSDPDCGDTTAQAVIHDMLSAQLTTVVTRTELTDRWSAHSGDTKTGLGLGKWSTLETNGDYTSLLAAIPSTSNEDAIWAIEHSSGKMMSVALAMMPGNVTYSNPIVSGQALQTMLHLFGQGPALLRQFGVSLPLPDYSSLEGVNACGRIWFGMDFWARLVQVSDEDNVYYFYVRSPTEAEQQSAAIPDTSMTWDYAYPPLGQETYASFAPPLPSTPDVSGNPDASITPIPSLVIRIKSTAWDKPFIGTVTPMPDGSTMYRYPDDDGDPAFALANPFSAAQMASGVDALTFVGLKTSIRGYPAGSRMLYFFETIVNQPTGEGLFYLDGTRVVCHWVGGTVDKPKRGVVRSLGATCEER